MRQIEITMELARARGTYAGNRSMRRVGRTSWNDEDYAAACVEMARLWPYAAKREYVEWLAYLASYAQAGGTGSGARE